MRDNISGEVARTLYPYGFYKKFPDAGYRNPISKQMAAQENPGMADGIFITSIGKFPCPAFIEAKTGDRTNFPFDKWTPQQQDFAVACAWSGIPYWMFLTMGNRIGGKEYPRVAYMVTGLQMAEILQEALPRKSLSYGTAALRWERMRLEWAGNSRWTIPVEHDFQHIIQGTYDGYNPLRGGILRSDRTTGSPTTRADRQNLPSPFYFDYSNPDYGQDRG